MHQRVQRNNSPGLYSDVHSDVARESYSFDLFDMPLECKKAGIHGLCIPVDSFDLRCESATLGYTYHKEY